MRKIAAFIFLIVVAFLGFLWWNYGTSAVNPSNKSLKTFIVEKDSGIRIIADNLQKQGLIHNPIIFYLYVKKNGEEKNIQAGDYKLSPSMDLKKIVDTLSHGILDVWVTIPEGYRAEQIADTLQKDIPSYEPSWRQKLDAQEGYLFPDTYLIPRDATIDSVLAMFKVNFDKKIKEAGLDNRTDLSRIIIIASMVEREALTDAEKPIIASVIANRLRQGMALNIDATLQYAKGEVNGKWWTVPTAEDKNIDSPYNTYLNAGLPPGPISNPGIKAIEAAANPANTDYFFYLHDSQGHVHFAKTLEEHQANINKYL